MSMTTPDSNELRRLVPGIVDDIVSSVDPARILLFGSVTRGEAGRDSDLDFLVILDDLTPGDRVPLMGQIRRSISAPAAIDVLVTDLGEFERRKDVNGSPYYWPAREGECVYERAPAERAG